MKLTPIVLALTFFAAAAAADGPVVQTSPLTRQFLRSTTPGQAQSSIGIFSTNAASTTNVILWSPTINGGTGSLTNPIVSGGTFSGTTNLNTVSTNPIVSGGTFSGGTFSGGTFSGTTNLNTVFTSPVLSGTTFTGALTNLATDMLPLPKTSLLNAAPVPFTYFMTGYKTNATDLQESALTNELWFIATNFPAVKLIQLDAAWCSARDANGNLQFNPLQFPHGDYFVQLAHQLGLKIGLYLDSWTPTNAIDSFEQIGSGGNLYNDCMYCITNFGVDGFKIDGGGNLPDFQAAAQAVMANGKTVYLELQPSTNYLGSGCTVTPQMPSIANCVYAGYQMLDPDQPIAWTNTLAHFLRYLPAWGYIRPGFYLTGCSWPEHASGLGANNYNNIAILCRQGYDLAAISCSPIMWPSVETGTNSDFGELNSDFLSILQDPLVVPGRVVGQVLDPDGTTNTVWVRPLINDNRAVLLLNLSTGTTVFPVTTAELGFTSNTVFTLESPWSHAIEGWYTNTAFLSVTDHTELLRAMPGFVLPPLKPGPNLLSDFPWQMTSQTNAGVPYENVPGDLSLNYRSDGTPLQIGNFTYAHGWGAIGTVAPWQPVFWQMPLGGITTNFTCDFGLQYNWSGVFGRLQIYTNGALAFDSGYVGATGIPLHIQVPTFGVNEIAFYASISNNASGQLVIGNPTVTVPATGPDLSPGFSGLNDGLIFDAPFSEMNGTNVTDYSQYHDPGYMTLSPVQWSYGGHYGGCVQLGGTNYLQCPVLPGDYFGTGGVLSNFTAALWVKFPTNSPAGQTFFSHVADFGISDPGDIWCGLGGQPNQLLFGSTTTAGTANVIGSVSAFSANQWYQVVMTYDGGSNYFYVNGALVATQPQTGTLPNDGQYWQAGYGVYPGNGLNATIDNFEIWNRALSSAEVAKLYTQ